MSIEIIEACDVIWLDERQELPLAALADLSGLPLSELQQLVECETLTPVNSVEPAAEARFGARSIALARAASRLRHDFDLDGNGLALTLRLLKRVHELEAELRDLRAQWPQITR